MTPPTSSTLRSTGDEPLGRGNSSHRSASLFSQRPAAQLKVVLVHDWLTGMRGGEKCLEAACRFFPNARLLTLLRRPGSTSQTIERMRIQTSLLQRLPHVTRYYRYLLPIMPLAIERFSIPDDTDLVLSFSHCVAKSVRVPKHVPHVCYCFSPMRYAWHMRDHYISRLHPRQSAILRPFTSLTYRVQDSLLRRIQRWDRETSRQVTHFIAISQTIAQRIRECYGRGASLLYPPVDTDFYCPAAVPREDYYLCVSALVPYKRHDLAIEACNRLGKRLLVIGSGPEAARLANQAGPTVTMLGWQTDEQIRHHLRRCRALLFPGLEDFGIVPLEAQACGAAVIAFGQGGATETVLPAGPHRKGTGCFFTDQTIDGVCTAIEEFETHVERFDPHLARQQAERFSTVYFERGLRRLLEEVLARKTTDADATRRQYNQATDTRSLTHRSDGRRAA